MGEGQMERGGEAKGVVCFVQGYFENTVGTEQINIVGKRRGCRQNTSKYALRNATLRNDFNQGSRR